MCSQSLYAAMLCRKQVNGKGQEWLFLYMALVAGPLLADAPGLILASGVSAEGSWSVVD